MESISTKDFFDKINNDDLKPQTKIVGMVKKSDKKNEVLFAFKTDLTKWIAIPDTMIESVKLIKNISFGEKSFTLAKLYLKTPANPEAKILFELLAVLSQAMHQFHHMMMAHGMGELHMHDGCMHSHMGMFSPFHKSFSGHQHSME